MEIHKVPINSLISPEWNPRQITDEELTKLETSLKEFGYIEPIIVNDVNNHIVGGNQRCKALKQLGYDEVDVVYVHIEDLAKEKACNVALNKISGDWDNDKLRVVLEEIELSPFDINITGFDEIELTEFKVDETDNDYPEQSPEIIEDNYQDENIEVTVEEGDLYQLGNHRLMCGDSTKKDDILKLLNNNKIDMVYTDAPYGISIVNEKTHNVGSENLAKCKQYLKIKGDDTTDTAKKFYNHCISLNIDNFILWGGNYFTDFLPFSPSWLIWDKRVDMKSNNFADGEMAWCNFKTPVRIYHQLWNGMIREGEHEDKVHPTQKPIKMQCEILMDFTNENYNILDGFGGSGSTLIACEQLNRNCYMMEYEPYYCQVIINRWEEFTGEKAEKIEA